MGIIDRIRESEILEHYIEKTVGQKFKNVGMWKTLNECPFCGGHECARLSKQDKFYCFQCQSFSGDVIQFRSLYENILWKEAVQKFAEEMGLKKYSKKDVDWVGIREMACEISKDILNTCQTKYLFRGKNITPLQYLTDIRQHSYESISYFRLGFNDGTLEERLKKHYSDEVIKSSGLKIIQNGIFMYPVIVNGEIKYFRLKDPNKIKKIQMPMACRSKDAYWYNQDCIKNGIDLIIAEGEDDIISLWEAGENVIGSMGPVTKDQVNYLKGFDLITIYAGFDSDSEGERDIARLTKNYDSTNVFVFKYPNDCKDPDEVLRGKENKEEIIEQLKRTANIPSPEIRSLVKQKPDGYFISIDWKGNVSEKRLTNWIGIVEAIIIKEEGQRDRKIKIKRGKYETIVFIDGDTLSNASRFRAFLLNNCNETCLFTGTDTDLNALVQYWGIAYNPIIVKETECVGEIEEGFIADNVFIGYDNEIKPLMNGYLQIDNKHSIKIAEISNQAGARAEIPCYSLNEPHGGIDKFKRHVFDLLIRNRNLKVGIGIGWMKATLWSTMFFREHKFFPLLMIHGKMSSGKTIFSSWLMSILGMRDVSPVSLRTGGTTSVGIERRLAYYSSLPVWTDDYKNEENEGQKFHTFFRNVFNRVSASKGIKNKEHKIRQVIVRGCLLIDGETSPTDAALNSRMVAFELTSAERTEKYYYDLKRLEPEFNHIGFNWLKNRIKDYPLFIKKFEEIDKKFRNEIGSPRQAQVWSVAIASALTEPYFAEQEDKVLNYAIRLANHEIEQQKSEETIGSLWEALDILYRTGKLVQQGVYHDKQEQEAQINLPILLGAISGESLTRKYKLPNSREVAKLLKQENYIIGSQSCRIDGKPTWCWVIDLAHDELPEILKNLFSFKENESAQPDFNDL
jgi:hypothetical protein